MTVELPHFLKQSKVIAHAPGLFCSLTAHAPDKLVEVDYTVNAGLRVRFVGPRTGAAELAVQQSLMALAALNDGWQRKPAFFKSASERASAMLKASATVQTSINELARVAGYQPNSGGCTIVGNALDVLCSISVFVGQPGTPPSDDVAVGHMFRKGSGLPAAQRGDTLSITLCPILAAAVLGGEGEYLRVSLDEVRGLESKAARLLHHRLHWINQGETRDVGIEKLTTYVHPDIASSSTHRKRRERVRDALGEFEAIGWTFKRAGDLYRVTRPGIRPSKSVTPGLPNLSRPPSESVVLDF